MANANFRRQGNVGIVSLVNPPQNRLNRDMAQQIDLAVSEAANTGIRALLFHGEGDHFCLGADIAEWPEMSIAELRTFVTKVNHLFQRIEELPFPTIAAVHGGCMGGGFELALHCDLVLAAHDSVFRFPEATLAAPPLAGGVQRLAERVGSSLASRLILLAEEMSGAEALDRGVAARTLDRAELLGAAVTLATAFAEGPTLAYQSTKALLRSRANGGLGAADRLLPDIADLTLRSSDFAKAVPNAVDAFKRGVPRPVLKYEGK